MKLKIFLLGIICCFIGCQNDEISLQNEMKNDNVKHMKASDVFKEQNFKNAIYQINEKKSKNRASSSKTIMEHEYDFTINESELVNVIENDSLISYTLFIDRSYVYDYSIENLIINIKKNSNEVSAYIIKYESTSPIENLLNFSGKRVLTPILYTPNLYNSSGKNRISPGCIVISFKFCTRHDNPYNNPDCDAVWQDYQICTSGGGGGDYTTSGSVPTSTTTSGSVSGAVVTTAPVQQASILALKRKEFILELTSQQQQWLFNDENNEAETQIFNYLEYSSADTDELEYTPDKKLFVKQIIQVALQNLFGADFIKIKLWEQTRINPNGLKTCMKNILNDIKKLNNGSVGQIIQKFDGNIPNFNWVMKDGLLTGGTVAETNTPGQYNQITHSISTTFDTQTYPDASELSWARTILHESVHAYLSVYFATNKPSFMGTYTQMVNDWGIYMNWDAVHHEEFARSLVKEIANSLEEYGINKGYNLPRQFYDDMSWAGLQGTTTFQSLSTSDKNRILNVIAVELTKFDTNGNLQTQKGNPSGC